jgi:hypothetical protein
MDKLYLLKEYTSFDYDKDDKDTVEALKDRSKPLFLTGVIQRFDVLNKNGRVYSKDILLAEIENYNNVFVKGDCAWGELDHADSPIVSTKNICHIIKKIWVEGNAVKAKIQILNNANGDIVRSMVEAGGKPGISSRAVGSLEKKQFGNHGIVDFVGDDLQIICWDIVSEPSTPGAYMSLTEARELKKEEIEALNEYNTKFQIKKRNHKLNKIMNEILSLRKTK